MIKLGAIVGLLCNISSFAQTPAPLCEVKTDASAGINVEVVNGNGDITYTHPSCILAGENLPVLATFSPPPIHEGSAVQFCNSQKFLRASALHLRMNDAFGVIFNEDLSISRYPKEGGIAFESITCTNQPVPSNLILR